MTATPTAPHPQRYPQTAYRGVVVRLPSGKPWKPRIGLLLAGFILGWLLHSLTR